MTEGREGSATSPQVFISYAHESDEHVEAVRDLWLFLRSRGIDARLDRIAAQHRQDWALWMGEQVRDADHVLVIASDAYRRRAEGRAEPDEGRGAQWEARLIRDAFYRDQRGLDRWLPVVLPGASIEGVPDFLAPATTTVYRISDYTVDGAEPLLRLLTGQPAEIEPDLGAVPLLPAGAREPGTGDGAAATRSVLAALPGLRHELVVEIEPIAQGAVRAVTSVAGTVLAEQTAQLPTGLDDCWDNLSAPSAADRLAALGRGLWRALFDEVTGARVMELVDHSPWGTVVDVVFVLEDLMADLPVELLCLPDGRLLATVPGVRFTRRLSGARGRRPRPWRGR